MKAKDALIIALSAFVLGLSYPYWKEWLGSSAEAPCQPPSATFLPLPEEGVPEDAFTCNLLHTALNARPEGNILLAPNSLAAILIQMRPMASDELAERLDALPLPETLQESAANVREAACLFADTSQPLDSRYAGTAVLPAPFSNNLPQALSTINTAIASFTAGAIRQVTDSELTPAWTGLASVNVLSFDTPWHYPVPAKESQTADFYNADGGIQRVRMMSCKGSFRIVSDPEGQWKAAALFFQPPRTNAPVKDTCCLIVVLPQNGQARKLATAFTPSQIAALRTALAHAPETDGRIEIPCLSFQARTQDVTPILRLLGIDPLFTDPTPLPRLTQEKPLPFTRALQSCHIILSESEARPGITPSAPEHTPILLQLNRPFLWFLGSLTSPAPPYAAGLIEKL